MKTIPNPGSKEAQEMGCICPVIDNHYGRGISVEGKIQFWMIEGCPLHDLNAWSKRLNNAYRQGKSTKRHKNR